MGEQTDNLFDEGLARGVEGPIDLELFDSRIVSRTPGQKQTPDYLKQLQEKINATPFRFEPIGDYLSHIIIFPQMRDVLKREETDTLAQSIATTGLLQSPIINELTPERYYRYAREFSEIIETPINPDDFDPFRGQYYVMVAGQRRYEGIQILAQTGCGCLGEGVACLHRHYPGNMFIKIYSNLDADAAGRIQSTENSYVTVDPARAAEVYARAYNLLSTKYPEMTKSDFAKTIGRSLEVVTSALLFCSLPEDVKQCVREKAIPYRTAVDMAKYYEASQELIVQEAAKKLRADPSFDSEGFVRHEIELLVKELLDLPLIINDNSWSTRKTKDVLEIRLRDKGSDQLDLQSLMEQSAEEQNQKIARKRILAAELRAGLQTSLSTLHSLRALTKADLLDPRAESPFLEVDAIDYYSLVITAVEETHPHLLDLISFISRESERRATAERRMSKAVQRAEEITFRTKRALAKLRRLLAESQASLFETGTYS